MERKVTSEEYDLAEDFFQRLPSLNLWRHCSKDDFIVTRFDDGYNGNIMKCELTTEARQRFDRQTRYNGQPRAVVVKVVPKENLIPVDPIDQAIIHAILAEQNLTAKLLLASSDGFILEYVESRAPTHEDEIDPEMSKKMAVSLARFHSILMPVSKVSRDLFIEMFTSKKDGKFLADMETKKLGNFDNFPQYREQFYKKVVGFDWRTARDRIWSLLEASGSPMVFSHNDLYRGNRMVTSDGRMLFIDFEFCFYCGRGSDLGRYFSHYQHIDDIFGCDKWPTDEEMSVFLEPYRQEFARIKGKQWLEDERNSMEALIRESKLFAIYVHLIDCVWAIKMFSDATTIKVVDRFLNGFDTRFIGYQRLWKMFTDDGTIAYFEQKLQAKNALKLAY